MLFHFLSGGGAKYGRRGKGRWKFLYNVIISRCCFSYDADYTCPGEGGAGQEAEGQAGQQEA
jgi:hypothetical protein